MAEQESFLDRLKGTITYQALESLGRSAMLPGQVWGGEVAVDSPEGIGRALEFAGNAPLGAVASVAGMAARGITPDPGTLSTFIGPRTLEGLGMATRPSKHDADLLRASMDTVQHLPPGATPNQIPLGHPAVRQLDDIWRAQDAPWFVGPDQYLKRELQDTMLDAIPPAHYIPDIPHRVIARHNEPNLFPTLGTEVGTIPNMPADTSGLFSPTHNAISLPNRPTTQETLAHELQHAIQNFEGWQGGQHWNNLRNHPATVAEHFTGTRPGNPAGQISREQAASNTYNRFAGEAEARAVEQRLIGNYTGHPLTYWDIPFNRLLHK